MEHKTVSFYICHPCYCLEEALVTFLKCLGFESTQIKEENSSTSLLKHHASASDAIVASEYQYNSSSSSQEHSQKGVADSSSTSTQTLNLSSMGRGGPRRTPLTKDPPAGHN
ncbi:hypothetical protein RYX36_025407 [Vicia faba]